MSQRRARVRGINQDVFREARAEGLSELDAQYVAYVAAFGEHGCWKPDRTVAPELPAGQRGAHHPKSLPRTRVRPRVIKFLSSRRIAPLGVLPGAKKLRSRHGAVHVTFLPYLRAAQRKRQRERSNIPPGLLEHEARKVTNAEEALAVLGWSSRGPPT